MDERLMQFRLGVMVLASLLITAILMLILTETGFTWLIPSDTYTIYAYFEDGAPSVKKDTPVREAGTRIGRAGPVKLADELSADQRFQVKMARIQRRQLELHGQYVRLENLEKEGRLKPEERRAKAILQEQLENLKQLEKLKTDENEGRKLTPEQTARKSQLQQEFAGELREPIRGVLVALLIDKGRRLYQDDAFQTGVDLLGGASAIDVLPPETRDPAAPPQQLQNYDYVLGTMLKSPSLVIHDLYAQLEKVTGTAETAGAAFTGAAHELRTAARNLNETMTKDMQQNIQNAARDAAKSLSVIGRITEDPAIEKLPNTIERMNSAFVQADDAFRKLTRPTGPDGKSAVDELRDAITSTRETMRMVEGQVSLFTERGSDGMSAADKLRKAISDLEALTDKLNSPEGTLGQLVNNPELYQHLNRAAKNIDEASRQLQPIVNDARDFSDKAARHPGIFLRDAVRPGPGVKR